MQLVSQAICSFTLGLTLWAPRQVLALFALQGAICLCPSRTGRDMHNKGYCALLLAVHKTPSMPCDIFHNRVQQAFPLPFFYFFPFTFSFWPSRRTPPRWMTRAHVPERTDLTSKACRLDVAARWDRQSGPLQVGLSID